MNVTNASVPVTGSVSVGNLPLDGSGKVKVASSSLTKTAVLFDDAIDSGETLRTLFTDVRGCEDFTIFILNAGDLSTTSIDDFGLTLSVDGQHPYGEGASIARFQGTEGNQVNMTRSFSASTELVGQITPVAQARFAGARIQAPSGTWPTHNITVTLYCDG